MESLSRGVKIVSFATCFIGTIPLLKTALSAKYNREELHEGRTAIVTGATENFGLALSFQLARRKVRVIMACKDMEKCRLARREIVLATSSNNIVCRYLDIEDIDSINSFVDKLIKNEPHIDILINSSTIKDVQKKELTKYGIEKNYFINFLAPFLLTFRLLDKLEESAKVTLDSRVVNVTGYPRKRWEIDLDDINFEKRKYTSKKAYEQSKLALAYFTILLENYNKERKNNVYVYASDPIFTRLGDPLERPTEPLEQLLSFVKSYTDYNADRAVGSTLHAAIEPGIGDRSKSGKLLSFLHRHWTWGKADKNMDEAKRVWNLASKQLLQIPETREKENLTTKVN